MLLVVSMLVMDAVIRLAFGLLFGSAYLSRYVVCSAQHGSSTGKGNAVEQEDVLLCTQAVF